MTTHYYCPLLMSTPPNTPSNGLASLPPTVISTPTNTHALLHTGDLSEYNILWHDEKPVIIDVSQSVEHSHPLATGNPPAPLLR